MTTVETNTSGGLVPEWTIGDRLRKARTWANISAETMARAIGRSVRTVSNYDGRRDAGLRTFEIAQLDAADVWTHAEPPVVVVRNGKGSKDRSVPMHPMLRELLADLPSAGFLFPSNRNGRSMHPESVARVMTRHMQASGVDGTPHQLRHSFGSELANRSGGDMVLTAALMGHESMTTTLGYVRLVGGRSADVVTAMFPASA